MKSLSRRSFLRTSTLLGATALTACAVTTTNGVTTITLDVAKVKAYGQAGLNAAATVSSFLSAFPALAPYAAAISVADTALSGALKAFSDAAGSTLTINYNDASWQTRVSSVLSGMTTVAGAINSAIAGSGSILSATVIADAKTADNALVTIISVFEALLGISSTRAPVRARMTRDMVFVGASNPATGMTEAQALAILGVK
ncbi:hypothetical protein ACQ5TV_05310 [Acetobacter ghanensis]|uniref:hypothetical protein n=1 Tax=Acetobacter ghanensis TaxID=431306 RepID=UPI003D329C4B